jgi:hypothetical protein
MRIILLFISFTLLAEAGVHSFVNEKENILIYLAAEGAAEEEELPAEKDNLNPDKQYAGNDYYNKNYYMQKQNYALSVKYNLCFVFHPIFSPPPEC